MIQKIQRDFLLLFQCIIDFGAEVLRDFTMKKIKTKYSCDDFSVFLKDEKHCFYHQWEKNKTACCECPAHGCTLPKTGKVEKTLFYKLYFFDTAMKWPKGHVKVNDSVISQKCICRYTASAITVKELDLSDLYATLINSRIITMITKHEASLMTEIMTIRGSVCHAVKTTTFSESELAQLWESFTNALYKLFPGDPKWVKIACETIQTKMLSEEDVQELMSNIGLTPTEVQDISINFIENQTKELKNCVATEGTSIKTCINESLQPISGQLKDLQKDHRKLTDKVDILLDTIGKQNIRVDWYPEQIVQLPETSKSSDAEEIKINSKLSLPGLTTEEEYQVTKNIPSEIEIPTVNDSLLDAAGKEKITVMATKVDSIILELKATPGIFKSVDILKLAIITLVHHVQIAGEIDTNVEDTVTVNLKFESPLTKDQIAVIKCMFSKEWNDDNNDAQLSDEHPSTANVANIDFNPEPKTYSQQDTSSQTPPYNCRNCFKKGEIIILLDSRLCEIRRRTVKETSLLKDLMQLTSLSTSMVNDDETKKLTVTKLTGDQSSLKSGISDSDVGIQEAKAKMKSMELQPGKFQGAGSDQDKWDISSRISELRREYAGNSYTKEEGQKGLAIILGDFSHARDPIVSALEDFFEDMGFVVKCIYPIYDRQFGREIDRGNFYCLFLISTVDVYKFCGIHSLLHPRVQGQPTFLMTESASHYPYDFRDLQNEPDTMMVSPLRDPYREHEECNIFDDFMKVTRCNPFADIIDILTGMNALYDRPVISFKSSLKKKFFFV